MRKIFGLGMTAVFASLSALSQTTYLPIGSDDQFVIERMETKSGRLSNEIFTSLKGYSRKQLVPFAERILGAGDSMRVTKIDQYNLKHLISCSGEWAADGDGAIDSKHPWFHTFYKKQSDFFSVNNKDLFLSINPVISAGAYSESYEGGSQRGFESSRGLEIRGRVANKVGFYTYITDCQEQPVSYVDRWIKDRQAVPGADYFLNNTGSRTFDYMLGRGYFDFAAVKNHINVTFGYDKQFFGDGMRSLFLSDFSANATFLRLRTQVGRFNYQNLYLELTPQYTRGADQVLPHKYATINHLSINAARWLNIGFFEGVIFDRTGGYEISYLNPVIFYRAIERALGSPDNALIGFDFKIIAAKRLQLYSQFILDEFRSKDLLAGNGHWANKFGLQLGGKYFDAFGAKNLDIQGEMNLVRPFTYTHSDTLANYTHYNQPLAHPLGASFLEFIGLLRYQPMPKLMLTLKGMFYKKGVDSGGVNFGTNIFRSYNDNRIAEVGYSLISGVRSKAALLNFMATYELAENLFLDLGVTHRERTYVAVYPAESSTWFNFGVRLNFVRRDWNFY